MTVNHPTRVALITGTSSGIGLATAVTLADAGWTTVATMREPRKATALREAADAAGVDIDVRAIDVTDPDTIRTGIDSVIADHGRLDAVVNNAGSAYVGTLENDDFEDVRACMEVNFFGVVQTSQVVLPHLRASGGRLLTVSSVGGVVGQPFNEAYCAAKFAVEGFMQALAPVAATVGVSVGVIEPGAVTSEFVNNLGLDIPTLLNKAGPYAPALQTYIERTAAQFEEGATNAQTPAQVGEIIRDTLAADPMPFRLQTSTWARDFCATSLSDIDGNAVKALTEPWVAS